MFHDIHIVLIWYKGCVNQKTLWHDQFKIIALIKYKQFNSVLNLMLSKKFTISVF